MKKWLAIFALAIAPSVAAAQNQKPHENIIREILTNAAETENEDDMQIAQITSEYLENISNCKASINTSNTSELQGIPFVTEKHIDLIRNYRQNNSDILSMGELKSIKGISPQTAEMMGYFCNMDQTNPNARYTAAEMLKGGIHTVTTTLKTVLEKEAGYKSGDNQAPEYEGNSMGWCVKYRYNFKKRLAWGITTEKDPGESMAFGKKKYGFDFNSIFLKIENEGKVERLILGDYTAKFGQGLVLGGGFSLGKFVANANFANTENLITEYGSCNEIQFYRGTAATFRFGKTAVTTFASKNLTDGNIYADSFSGIRTDGYHRTEKELSRKDNLLESNYGIMATSIFGPLKLGFCTHYYNFSKTFVPKDQLRNITLDQTKDGIELSGSYRLEGSKICLYGESAMDRNQNMATINILDFIPCNNLKFSLLQRHYSKRYQAFKAYSFGQNSKVNNESGFYGGITTTPAKWIAIDGWVDIYRFPWATSSSKEPSNGQEYLAQARFFVLKNYNIQLRIKKKISSISSASNDNKESGYMKISNNYSPTQDIRLNTTAQWSQYQNIAGSEKGYLVYQNISYSPRHNKIMLAARYALFSAPYNARIYSYENDVAYFFSAPGYYNRGQRYYLVLGTQMIKKVNIQCRISQWHYFDRQKISSGPSEIDGPRKTELNVYLKYSI
ncbi:MAG: helix-hairpin-helix domain-containing protein [Bacteroidales bacterium]|nr:helix-hairpin-helix domain-containing protein [Bacteroidales bacterium]